MSSRRHSCLTLRLAAAVVLITALTLSVAFAGKKPTPPPSPTPLVLSDYLNVVAAQGTQLSLLTQSEDGSFAPSAWTEAEYGSGAVVLTDFDGDGVAEIVVGRTCAVGKGNNLQYGAFLNVFKNNYAGVWRTNYYDTTTYLWGGSNYSIRAFNLVGDGASEIVLRSGSKIGVFGYDKTTELIIKLSEYSFADFTSSPFPLGPRDFDIGDVDGDSQPEIVVVASYRPYQFGPDVEYLFLLEYQTQTLGLESWYNLYKLDQDSGTVITPIGDFSIGTLRIADCDGNGQKEIWAAGWQNHWELSPYQYDNRLYAWQIVESGALVSLPGLDTDPTTLPLLDYLDVDGKGTLSATLGPRMSVGNLLFPTDGDAKDEIVLHRNDPSPELAATRRYLEVYGYNQADIFGLAGQPILYEGLGPTRTVIAQGRLFVEGFIRNYTPTRNGHFIEHWYPANHNPTTSLQNFLSETIKEGEGELSGIAAGLGKPAVPAP